MREIQANKRGLPIIEGVLYIAVAISVVLGGITSYKQAEEAARAQQMAETENGSTPAAITVEEPSQVANGAGAAIEVSKDKMSPAQLESSAPTSLDQTSLQVAEKKRGLDIAGITFAFMTLCVLMIVIYARQIQIEGITKRLKDEEPETFMIRMMSDLESKLGGSSNQELSLAMKRLTLVHEKIITSGARHETPGYAEAIVRTARLHALAMGLESLDEKENKLLKKMHEIEQTLADLGYAPEREASLAKT